MKIKIINENNELEKRAKKHKATDCKGAMGWFANPGDPKTIDSFNNSVDGEALGEKLIMEEDEGLDIDFYAQIEGVNIFTNGDKFYDEEGYEYETLQDLLDYYFPGEEIEIEINETLSSKDKDELKKVIDATDDEETINAFLKIKKDGLDEELDEQQKRKKELWEKITSEYRRWACIAEDVVITEDNIDDYALNRTAVVYSKPTALVRNRLLNKGE